MSGSCVKLNKASKMSDNHPLVQITGNSPTFRDSAVTFENNERRSVEIKKLTPSGNNSTNIRTKTQSKSIDSATATSNLQEVMLKPKGIEVHSMSMGGTSSNVGTPHAFSSGNANHNATF